MIVDNVPPALTEAFAAGRIEVTRHFGDELKADAFDYADVRSAIDSISHVRDMGFDQAGHSKFEVTGPAIDGRRMSVICAYKEENNAFLFITAYEDK